MSKDILKMSKYPLFKLIKDNRISYLFGDYKNIRLSSLNINLQRQLMNKNSIIVPEYSPFIAQPTFIEQDKYDHFKLIACEDSIEERCNLFLKHFYNNKNINDSNNFILKSDRLYNIIKNNNTNPDTLNRTDIGTLLLMSSLNLNMRYDLLMNYKDSNKNIYFANSTRITDFVKAYMYLP